MNKIVQSFWKAFFYTKRVGLRGLCRRLRRKFQPQIVQYGPWLEKHGVNERRKSRNRRQMQAVEPIIDVLVLGNFVNAEKLRMGLKRQIWRPRGMHTDIKYCRGEYILLVSEDIKLEEDALWQFYQAIENYGKPDMLYCDHDINYEEPVFKPDFNYDLLLSYNYIGNVIAVRRDVLERILALKQEKVPLIYDIILRMIELGGEDIVHIAMPLYHSFIKRTEKKTIIKKIIGEHLARMGYNVTISEGVVKDTWHIQYEMDKEPLVSIIIPNKDHADDLNKCLESVFRQSYKKYEIIVVENNSEKADTFKYYERLTQKYTNVRVLCWTKAFNYSLINNYGVREAKGDYLLFLNNDIEFTGTEAIREMLGVCMRKDVGVVGAKLFYPDDSIQHAGVIVGYGGIAGHAFLGAQGSEDGYMNRLKCCQNYSAVTAACMMVKREAFYKVRGFNGKLQVAFNDVDFCLKVLSQGYRIVYTPFAEAYHYESKTRGIENSYKKIKRFNQEVDMFRVKWKDIISTGDSAYNRNLSLYRWDFSLKY